MEYRESGIEQRNFSISMWEGRGGGGLLAALFHGFPLRINVSRSFEVRLKEKGERERERGANVFFSVFIFNWLRFTTKEQLTYVNIRIYAANDS